MAHALHRYDGKCENIHGHTYHLTVTILGSPEKSDDSKTMGMVMDFSDLKRVVQDQVLDHFDHALVLNQNDPRTKSIQDISSKLILTPYQPTSENLLIDFVERLTSSLPETVELYSLKLRETPSSFAEWNADDNR